MSLFCFSLQINQLNHYQGPIIYQYCHGPNPHNGVECSVNQEHSGNEIPFTSKICWFSFFNFLNISNHVLQNLNKYRGTVPSKVHKTRLLFSLCSTCHVLKYVSWTKKGLNHVLTKKTGLIYDQCP